MPVDFKAFCDTIHTMDFTHQQKLDLIWLFGTFGNEMTSEIAECFPCF